MLARHREGFSQMSPRRVDESVVAYLTRDLPIGLFDSGVGGLTVARAVFAHLPNESIIYFGDTERTPYGPRPLDEVKGFVMQIVEFLVEQGVKLAVIACNTGTAAGLEAVNETFDIPIVGVIDPGAKSAVKSSENGKIGVIATEGTIASKAYVRAIRGIDRTVQIFEKACPLFVSLVENDEIHTDKARSIVYEYLSPVKDKGIDTLILGCTHYPFLVDAITEVMGPEVKLVFPAQEIALEVQRILNDMDLLNTSNPSPTHRFFVTGKPRYFKKIGERFFGEKLPAPIRVEL
jgi:glutamate racemase